MKKKNILIVFICIAFVTIVCLSCISAFSIARIEITFAAVKDSSPAYFKEVKEDLDSVIGKSLLFFNRKEIDEIVGRYPYLELTDVEKEYTNRLTISIREREEQYAVWSDSGYYMLDQDGLVLDKRSENTYHLDASLQNIELKFTGMAIHIPEIGSGVSAEEKDAAWLESVFAIGKAFYLRNTVESLIVNREREQVILSLKTGVSIIIERPLDFAEDKLNEAWDAYDTTLTDKQKSSGILRVYKKDDGTIERVYDSGGSI